MQNTLNNMAYKKLIVWEKADKLAHTIYQVTKKFPKAEMYGVTSQLRRSALSVPTNIVEGTGRQSKGELKQFANIALGSLFEVEYLLEFSHQAQFLSKEEFLNLDQQRKEVGALLWRFYKSC